MKYKNHLIIHFSLSIILLLPGTGFANFLEPNPVSGNAEADLNPDHNPAVQVFVDPGGRGDVAQTPTMDALGRINGWNIKDIRAAYSPVSDRLYVGVNFYGVAGDADGDGNPGHTDPTTSQVGGVDLPGLSGRESIYFGLDLDGNGSERETDVVAGVPSNKAHSAHPVTPDKFGPLNTAQYWYTVAQYQPSSFGRADVFGASLPTNEGGLLFEPSLDHPDFLATVDHLSSLPQFSVAAARGYFYLTYAFAGTPDDIVAGEDYALGGKIVIPALDVATPPQTLPPPISPPPTFTFNPPPPVLPRSPTAPVPEPCSLLGVLVGVAALRSQKTRGRLP